MKTLIEDLKKVMNSEIEDKNKYMQMLINGFIIERDNEQLNLSGVVVRQFEEYARFCIECDRKGLKPLKHADFLNIG